MNFQDLLSEAMHKMKAYEGKNISLIQDEIGYELGYTDGGSAVEKWRQPNRNPPPRPVLIDLAKIIYKRTGGQLSIEWFQDFFEATKLSYSEEQIREILLIDIGSENMSDSHQNETENRRLAQIKIAISLSDFAEARELLRQELVENPSKDAWYLASVLGQVDKDIPIHVENGIGQVTGGNAQVITGENAHVVQNINSAPPPPSIAQLIKSARQSLDSNNYDATIEACETIQQQQPVHPIGNIILAIALMRGEGVERCSEDTTKRIEGNVQSVTQLYSHVPLPWVMLGLVKHDYYLRNNQSMGSPNLNEIKEHFEPEDITSSDWELLNKATFSDKAYRLLGLTKPDHVAD